MVNYMNEETYLEILSHLQDGVYIVDTERRIVYWNAAAERITGYSQEDIVGQLCQANLLRHIDEKGTPLCIVGCPLFETLGDGQMRQAHVFLRHKEGYRVPILTKFFPVRSQDGTIIAAVEIFTAMSPKIYEVDLLDKLEDEATHDKLTSLSNRRFAESYIGYKIEQYERFENRFCVMFVDIDDFRVFNNTYGHEVGDQVLRAIAQSLEYGMRRNDAFSRWGGEEFVGVFEVTDLEELPRLAERIRTLIEGTQILHQEERLAVTVSGGLTLCQKGDTVEGIVHRADLLMYESKKKGKNCVTIG